MMGGIAERPMADLSSLNRRSTIDNLKDRKREMESRLLKINEAIELFEKNPEIARALDLMKSI